MLNWDDYGKEENNTPAVVNVSESVKEVQKAEAPAKPVMDTAAPMPSAENKIIEEGTRAETAREAVKNLDESAVEKKPRFLLTIVLSSSVRPSSDFHKTISFVIFIS
jgi:hypothetical protein